MAITAGDVKKLREMTGAGMMDCKKALSETNGNLEEAVDFLRKKGLAAAQKKQSRVAAEGAVITLVEGTRGVILEVNCETDFVSKGDDFQNFAKEMANYVLTSKPASIEALREAKQEAVNELTLKCGEKIDLRRFEVIEGNGLLGAYNHGGRIGVLVELSTDTNNDTTQEVVKDLAMHVAAANPMFLKSDDIDEDYKKRESDIYAAQLKEEGKPEDMIPKIVQGKINKLASEVCLLEQKFVKDPDLKINKWLAGKSKDAGTDLGVTTFKKLILGEGIEKKEDNLADEVAKMTQGN